MISIIAAAVFSLMMWLAGAPNWAFILVALIVCWPTIEKAGEKTE